MNDSHKIPQVISRWKSKGVELISEKRVSGEWEHPSVQQKTNVILRSWLNKQWKSSNCRPFNPREKKLRKFNKLKNNLIVQLHWKIFAQRTYINTNGVVHLLKIFKYPMSFSTLPTSWLMKPTHISILNFLGLRHLNFWIEILMWMWMDLKCGASLDEFSFAIRRFY